MWDLLQEIKESQETIEILEDALEDVGHHDHDIIRELSDEKTNLKHLLHKLEEVYRCVEESNGVDCS